MPIGKASRSTVELKQARQVRIPSQRRDGEIFPRARCIGKRLRLLERAPGGNVYAMRSRSSSLLLVKLTVAEPQSPAHAAREPLIMCCDHEGNVEVAVEPLKYLINFFGGLRIEITGRLVGQNQLWPEHDGPPHAHPLPLPPRNLRRPPHHF